MSLPSDALSGLSLSGLAAWFFYEKILPRLRLNGNSSMGSRSVDFFENKTRKIVSDILEDKLGPRFDAQNRLLEELKEISQQTRDGVNQMVVLMNSRRRR